MHQTFKNMAKMTRIFKNINKSLALKHQRRICRHEFSYEADIQIGKLNHISLQNQTEFPSLRNENNANIQLAKWIRINDYLYHNGFFVLHNGRFHEIREIIYDHKCVKVILQPYICLGFDAFLNSFEIDCQSDRQVLTPLEQILHKKPYEIKHTYWKFIIYFVRLPRVKTNFCRNRM